MKKVLLAAAVAIAIMPVSANARNDNVCVGAYIGANAYRWHILGFPSNIFALVMDLLDEPAPLCELAVRG